MVNTPKEHCTFVNSDGARCKAYQAKGTPYCIGHARKLGAIVVTEPPVVDTDGITDIVDRAIVDGYAKAANDMRPKSIVVDEPEALKALRQMQVQIELGGGVDPVLATQLSNILRPYLGIDPMGSVELANVIDKRIAADEQIAKTHAAKMELIDRSHDLIIENPGEVAAARIEAKVARDIEEAATSYRAKTEQMKFQLRNEPKDAVRGTGEDEIYMVNGVKIVVPAEGEWSVPRTIANLHLERAKQRQEKKARSSLMQSVPEYSQVYQKMAEIDRAFGSRSQLGGGPSQEQDDFLVAEEIK